jgi:alkylation response protein AidB-like acyl-CoA dehydrogenase
LATTAVTEATGGSDPTAIKSTYTREGDDFIVNGRKCFITNSHIANTITILAKAEDDPKAFCAFVIDEDMLGWKATRKEHKVAMRGCNTGELSFESLKISKSQLLGEEGKGLRVTMAAIGDVGRGGMVGTALGLQAACLEESIKFANQRLLSLAGHCPDLSHKNRLPSQDNPKSNFRKIIWADRNFNFRMNFGG